MKSKKNKKKKTQNPQKMQDPNMGINPRTHGHCERADWPLQTGSAAGGAR
jgi:hypothetical protein